MAHTPTATLGPASSRLLIRWRKLYSGYPETALGVPNALTVTGFNQCGVKPLASMPTPDRAISESVRFRT